MRDLALGIALLGLAAGVVAQEPSPSRGEAADSTTVQAILAKPVDDERVVLRGRIERQIDDDTFVLADNSGQIRVEIDDDDQPQGGIRVGMQVEIHGEVDQDDREEPEVEAERVVLL